MDGEALYDVKTSRRKQHQSRAEKSDKQRKPDGPMNIVIRCNIVSDVDTCSTCSDEICRGDSQINSHGHKIYTDIKQRNISGNEMCRKYNCHDTYGHKICSDVSRSSNCSREKCGNIKHHCTNKNEIFKNISRPHTYRCEICNDVCRGNSFGHAVCSDIKQGNTCGNKFSSNSSQRNTCSHETCNGVSRDNSRSLEICRDVEQTRGHEICADVNQSNKYRPKTGRDTIRKRTVCLAETYREVNRQDETGRNVNRRVAHKCVSDTSLVEQVVREYEMQSDCAREEECNARVLIQAMEESIAAIIFINVCRLMESSVGDDLSCALASHGVCPSRTPSTLRLLAQAEHGSAEERFSCCAALMWRALGGVDDCRFHEMMGRFLRDNEACIGSKTGYHTILDRHIVELERGMLATAGSRLSRRSSGSDRRIDLLSAEISKTKDAPEYLDRPYAKRLKSLGEAEQNLGRRVRALQVRERECRELTIRADRVWQVLEAAYRRRIEEANVHAEYLERKVKSAYEEAMKYKQRFEPIKLELKKLRENEQCLQVASDELDQLVEACASDQRNLYAECAEAEIHLKRVERENEDKWKNVEVQLKDQCESVRKLEELLAMRKNRSRDVELILSSEAESVKGDLMKNCHQMLCADKENEKLVKKLQNLHTETKVLLKAVEKSRDECLKEVLELANSLEKDEPKVCCAVGNCASYSNAACQAIPYGALTPPTESTLTSKERDLKRICPCDSIRMKVIKKFYSEVSYFMVHGLEEKASQLPCKLVEYLNLQKFDEEAKKNVRNVVLNLLLKDLEISMGKAIERGRSEIPKVTESKMGKVDVALSCTDCLDKELPFDKRVTCRNYEMLINVISSLRRGSMTMEELEEVEKKLSFLLRNTEPPEPDTENYVCPKDLPENEEAEPSGGKLMSILRVLKGLFKSKTPPDEQTKQAETDSPKAGPSNIQQRPKPECCTMLTYQFTVSQGLQEDMAHEDEEKIMDGKATQLTAATETSQSYIFTDSVSENSSFAVDCLDSSKTASNDSVADTIIERTSSQIKFLKQIVNQYFQQDESSMTDVSSSIIPSTDTATDSENAVIPSVSKKAVTTYTLAVNDSKSAKSSTSQLEIVSKTSANTMMPARKEGSGIQTSEVSGMGSEVRGDNDKLLGNFVALNESSSPQNNFASSSSVNQYLQQEETSMAVVTSGTVLSTDAENTAMPVATGVTKKEVMKYTVEVGDLKSAKTSTSQFGVASRTSASTMTSLGIEESGIQTSQTLDFVLTESVFSEVDEKLLGNIVVSKTSSQNKFVKQIVNQCFQQNASDISSRIVESTDIVTDYENPVISVATSVVKKAVMTYALSVDGTKSAEAVTSQFLTVTGCNPVSTGTGSRSAAPSEQTSAKSMDKPNIELMQELMEVKTLLSTKLDALMAAKCICNAKPLTTLEMDQIGQQVSPITTSAVIPSAVVKPKASIIVTKSNISAPKPIDKPKLSVVFPRYPDKDIDMKWDPMDDGGADAMMSVQVLRKAERISQSKVETSVDGTVLVTCPSVETVNSAELEDAKSVTTILTAAKSAPSSQSNVPIAKKNCRNCHKFQDASKLMNELPECESCTYLRNIPSLNEVRSICICAECSNKGDSARCDNTKGDMRDLPPRKKSVKSGCCLNLNRTRKQPKSNIEMNSCVCRILPPSDSGPSSKSFTRKKKCICAKKKAGKGTSKPDPSIGPHTSQEIAKLGSVPKNDRACSDIISNSINPQMGRMTDARFAKEMCCDTCCDTDYTTLKDKRNYYPSPYLSSVTESLCSLSTCIPVAKSEQQKEIGNIPNCCDDIKTAGGPQSDPTCCDCMLSSANSKKNPECCDAIKNTIDSRNAQTRNFAETCCQRDARPTGGLNDYLSLCDTTIRPADNLRNAETRCETEMSATGAHNYAQPCCEMNTWPPGTTQNTTICCDNMKHGPEHSPECKVNFNSSNGRHRCGNFMSFRNTRKWCKTYASSTRDAQGMETCDSDRRRAKSAGHKASCVCDPTKKPKCPGPNKCVNYRQGYCCRSRTGPLNEPAARKPYFSIKRNSQTIQYSKHFTKKFPICHTYVSSNVSSRGSQRPNTTTSGRSNDVAETSYRDQVAAKTVDSKNVNSTGQLNLKADNQDIQILVKECLSLRERIRAVYEKEILMNSQILESSKADTTETNNIKDVSRTVRNENLEVSQKGNQLWKTNFQVNICTCANSLNFSETVPFNESQNTSDNFQIETTVNSLAASLSQDFDFENNVIAERSPIPSVVTKNTCFCNKFECPLCADRMILNMTKYANKKDADMVTDLALAEKQLNFNNSNDSTPNAGCKKWKKTSLLKFKKYSIQHVTVNNMFHANNNPLACSCRLNNEPCILKLLPKKIDLEKFLQALTLSEARSSDSSRYSGHSESETFNQNNTLSYSRSKGSNLECKKRSMQTSSNNSKVKMKHKDESEALSSQDNRMKSNKSIVALFKPERHKHKRLGQSETKNLLKSLLNVSASHSHKSDCSNSTRSKESEYKERLVQKKPLAFQRNYQFNQGSQKSGLLNNRRTTNKSENSIVALFKPEVHEHNISDQWDTKKILKDQLDTTDSQSYKSERRNSTRKSGNSSIQTAHSKKSSRNSNLLNKDSKKLWKFGRKDSRRTVKGGSKSLGRISRSNSGEKNIGNDHIENDISPNNLSKTHSGKKVNSKPMTVNKCTTCCSKSLCQLGTYKGFAGLRIFIKDKANNSSDKNSTHRRQDSQCSTSKSTGKNLKAKQKLSANHFMMCSRTVETTNSSLMQTLSPRVYTPSSGTRSKKSTTPTRSSQCSCKEGMKEKTTHHKSAKHNNGALSSQAANKGKTSRAKPENIQSPRDGMCKYLTKTLSTTLGDILTRNLEYLLSKVLPHNAGDNFKTQNVDQNIPRPKSVHYDSRVAQQSVKVAHENGSDAQMALKQRKSKDKKVNLTPKAKSMKGKQDNLKPAKDKKEIDNIDRSKTNKTKELPDTKLQPIIITASNIKTVLTDTEMYNDDSDQVIPALETNDGQTKHDIKPDGQTKQDIKPDRQTKQDIKPDGETKQDIKPDRQTKLDIKPDRQTKQDIKLDRRTKQDIKPYGQTKQDIKPDGQTKQGRKNQKIQINQTDGQNKWTDNSIDGQTEWSDNSMDGQTKWSDNSMDGQTKWSDNSMDEQTKWSDNSIDGQTKQDIKPDGQTKQGRKNQKIQTNQMDGQTKWTDNSIDGQTEWSDNSMDEQTKWSGYSIDGQTKQNIKQTPCNCINNPGFVCTCCRRRKEIIKEKLCNFSKPTDKQPCVNDTQYDVMKAVQLNNPQANIFISSGVSPALSNIKTEQSLKTSPQTNELPFDNFNQQVASFVLIKKCPKKIGLGEQSINNNSNNEVDHTDVTLNSTVLAPDLNLKSKSNKQDKLVNTLKVSPKSLSISSPSPEELNGNQPRSPIRNTDKKQNKSRKKSPQRAQNPAVKKETKRLQYNDPVGEKKISECIPTPPNTPILQSAPKPCRYTKYQSNPTSTRLNFEREKDCYAKNRHQHKKQHKSDGRGSSGKNRSRKVTPNLQRKIVTKVEENSNTEEVILSEDTIDSERVQMYLDEKIKEVAGLEIVDPNVQLPKAADKDVLENTQSWENVEHKSSQQEIYIGKIEASTQTINSAKIEVDIFDYLFDSARASSPCNNDSNAKSDDICPEEKGRFIDTQVEHCHFCGLLKKKQLINELTSDDTCKAETSQQPCQSTANENKTKGVINEKFALEESDRVGSIRYEVQTAFKNRTEELCACELVPMCKVKSVIKEIHNKIEICGFNPNTESKANHVRANILNNFRTIQCTNCKTVLCQRKSEKNSPLLCAICKMCLSTNNDSHL